VRAGDSAGEWGYNPVRGAFAVGGRRRNGYCGRHHRRRGSHRLGGCGCWGDVAIGGSVCFGPAPAGFDSDPPDNLTYRDGVPGRGDVPQDSFGLGGVGHSGLVSFDLNDLLSEGDGLAVLHEPRDDGAAFHLVGQSRHQDVGHMRFIQ
jgi:hypothetical protein